MENMLILWLTYFLPSIEAVINNTANTDVTYSTISYSRPYSHFSSLTTIASNTKAEKILVRNLQCVSNFGECLSSNQTCPSNRALVFGLCDEVNNTCCIASQDEQKKWEAQDKECIKHYGECILETQNCAGNFENHTCGGTKHRRCCIPSLDEKEAWKHKDKVCESTMGTCQIDLETCAGTYQTDTCGGPKHRQCCLPESSIRLEWEKHDLNCHKKWGICQYELNACTGAYSKGLCGGPEKRRCCIPDEKTKSSWEHHDKHCLLKLGNCQYKYANCSGTYENDSDNKMCDGPKYRKCCIPDSNTIATWKAGDKRCSDKGGVCQSIGVECNAEYLPNFCGGPVKVRQCCVSPLKQGNKPNNSPGKEKPVPNKNWNSKNSRTVLLAVFIPFLVLLVVLMVWQMRKRRECCRQYRTLRGDPKKTPWYKMEYNELDDDEGVNLTVVDETPSYA